MLLVGLKIFAGDRKAGALPTSVHAEEANAAPDVSVGVAVSSSPITCKTMYTLPACGQTPGMTAGQLIAGGHPESWSKVCEFFFVASMLGLYHLK